ncbi:hypothetical protein [Kineothrix alysoides]|nr:hypothetical protein [Kineothrix alysoides]
MRKIQQAMSLLSNKIIDRDSTYYFIEVLFTAVSKQVQIKERMIL